MAVKIRLSRQGGKKKPFYRVVVADSEAPRNGKFIEVVGIYNPTLNPPKVELKAERVSHWLKNGATPTGVVGQLIKKAGLASQKPSKAA